MSGYPASSVAHAHSGQHGFIGSAYSSPPHQQPQSPASSNVTLDALIAPLHYSDKQRLINDLSSLLSQTNSLTPHLAPLPVDPPNLTTQPHHSPPLLLSLTGTVPIYYKHVAYHIPIAIYLPLHYPLHPPKVYVTPTRDMRIKERHKHVDSAGVVYLPYLHEWNGASGGSGLMGGAADDGVLGDSSSLVDLLTVMSSTFSDDPPVYKVGGSTAQVQPDKSPSQQQRSLPSQSHSSPVVSSRPLPPLPAASVPSPTIHSSAASISPSNLALPPLSQQSRIPSPEPLSPSSSLRQSLLSTLTTRSQDILRTQHNEMSSEIDSILSQQQTLQERRDQHDTALATLHSELQQLHAHSNALAGARQQLSEWLAVHEAVGSEKNVDELVYARDSWSRQLLECVVADQAIEDALWLLDRALSEGVVEFGVYVKLIRSYSRKQYFHRALAAQIQRRQAETKQHQAVGGRNSAGGGIGLGGAGSGVAPVAGVGYAGGRR